MDDLKNKQIVAYKSLSNALKLNKLSHCFLFEGPKTSAKLDLAYLLAAAIVLESDDLDLKESDVYKRITKNEYLDVFYIDGFKETIKKETIEKLYSSFNKTGVELHSKKVYIINNINNASNKVLNMLLKFMEEPNSEDIYGILISDDADNLLETIKSRTLNIMFVQDSLNDIRKQYIDNGINEDEALLIADIKHNYDEFINLDIWEETKHLYNLFIDNLNDFEQFIFVIQNQWYVHIKDYERTKIILIIDLFISMLIYNINKESESLRIINQKYNLFSKKENKLNILEILINSKEKFNNRFDYKLSFDQLMYNLYKEL